MRVPLSWLRDYVQIDLPPEALAEGLTLRGMEVSAIEITGTDWTDVVVGRLLSVERHPNADKLWLTSVDIGGEPLQIVCGADNIAPGQLVPVARVGAMLPGDRRIERGKIRGVVSDGMLCSAAELGLGDDATGIHILGEGDALPLGADLRAVLGEVVLDVDVKPNRGDALSMVGLAREIAAFTGQELRQPTVTLTEDPSLWTAAQVSVEIVDATACPRFTARLIEGVANGPSPAWMQQRLLAAGMRPISAVVDVTNYVMHELGQPMHAYDADAVPGGRIVVRRAEEGEELETIDHELRRLDPRMLVIADAEHAIGLAGIMGGAATEVADATTRVILESAIFHGPTVRNTARRLGLRSEASMRHEKGIGHELPRFALDRAAQLIAETTGGRIASGIVDNDPDPRSAVQVVVDLPRTRRLLGIAVDANEAAALIAPLGFRTEQPTPDRLVVSVPSHRLDVAGPEDVAEEIARTYGYERIIGTLPRAVLPHFRPDPTALRNQIRRTLAGMGLTEVLSYALIGPDDLRRSGYDPAADGLVRVANPLAEQHAIMRPVLYPSLLAGLSENVRQRRLDPWLFDIGKTYWMAEAGQAPHWAETAGTGRYEAWHLGVALLGPRTAASPGHEERDADLDDLKGILSALHEAIGAPVPEFRAEPAEERHPHLHPGRAGRLTDADGRPYGSVGEVHPAVAEAWGLPGRPLLAAVNLAQLASLIRTDERMRPIPPAQPVDRDLAVVVDEGTPLGELLRLLRTSAGPILTEARVFDVYRGSQVAAGRVSYAIALRFQPPESGDERSVERAMRRVQGALGHQLGATFR
jgi:phenylalanyl-tRNA synthetase beta chain